MVHKKYFLILDQGTTSSRSFLYDEKYNVIDQVSIKLTQSNPKNFWVEHDPLEIWNSQKATIEQILFKNNVSIDEIISIGITNQRETIVLWDKKTGIPVYNAIVWKDSRTIDYIQTYKKYENLIYEKTGLILNPYFSALKIKWILNNIPKAQELMDNDQLMIGTIDSWLLFKLSEHKIHATDHTNASRTMLFNIKTLSWDEEILDIFKIKKTSLPEIKHSADFYCSIDNKIIDPISKQTTPITTLVGDQQSSLFGHQCFNKLDTKATFGTGCFILLNTGTELIYSKNKLLTTLASTYKGNINYALEGSVFNCGIVIEWLMNNLGVLYNQSECDWYMTLCQNTNKELYFVPAFVGLAAPYWNNSAKGAIVGIDIDTKREDIIQAAINGICYQLKDVVNSMELDTNFKINSLNVDGGLTNSKYLCQFLSNILQCDVNKSTNTEITGLGCCYLTSIGYNQNKTDFKKTKNELFAPNISSLEANNLYEGWKENIKKLY